MSVGVSPNEHLEGATSMAGEYCPCEYVRFWRKLEANLQIVDFTLVFVVFPKSHMEPVWDQVVIEVQIIDLLTIHFEGKS